MHSLFRTVSCNTEKAFWQSECRLSWDVLLAHTFKLSAQGGLNHSDDEERRRSDEDSVESEEDEDLKVRKALMGLFPLRIPCSVSLWIAILPWAQLRGMITGR